jgi:hypothetical protein
MQTHTVQFYTYQKVSRPGRGKEGFFTTALKSPLELTCYCVKLTTHLHVVPSLKMSGAAPSFPRPCYFFTYIVLPSFAILFSEAHYLSQM